LPQLINWELAKNPLNWIIVGLMLMIAVFALNFITAQAGVSST
jgi:hypothetical protein